MYLITIRTKKEKHLKLAKVEKTIADCHQTEYEFLIDNDNSSFDDHERKFANIAKLMKITPNFICSIEKII